ncbi:MAG: glycosyltransferase family 2 protein [Spiribacter salinus]|uniref:Glycosyltransferase family 2 protein n=1 Tax=Spiribacter salinus TaxID=1335746 RepID=A0A540VNY6_9GAMM|nr:MAG: glycosyltransferase family 2 protein [Spiribacter salinus]
MSDISIVIPARNAAATLADALRSVLVAAEVAEVIVVDDGSTDGTARIAEQIHDPRIRVIPGPRSGIAAALNAGLAAVTQPFVARCDADDLYPPDRLTWQRAWLDTQPGFIAVSGGFATMFSDGTHAADLACAGEAREVTQQLLHGKPVTHLCSWLIRTEAVTRMGGARVWFISAEDLDLQFRLAEIGRIWHVPQVAYFYRLNDGSITNSSSRAFIAFFDEQARRFAAERRADGKDSLQLGHPPATPSPVKTSDEISTAADKAIGHIVSAAWNEFQAGRKGFAYRRLHSVLRKRPFSLTLWRHVLILNVKHLKRLIF